jgi:hypothetical protein
LEKLGGLKGGLHFGSGEPPAKPCAIDYGRS